MGSKRKRGEAWELQIYKGVDPVTGKKDYYYETFHGTERQADRRIAEIETDMARREFVEPSKLTFYQYLVEEFLPHVEADDTIGTWEDYRSITENHIKNDLLGRAILTDVTTRHVEAYKRRKLGGPRVDGRPGALSPKTVKNHLILIKAAFKYACVLEMFKVDPVKYAKFPKVPKYRPRVYDEDEAARFVVAAAEYAQETGSVKFYLFFLLAIYTGLRLGELRAIQRPVVDLEHCLISVVRKVRKDGNKAVFSDPKTEESIATVDFDPQFIPLFRQLQKEQIRDREKCLRLGIEYKDQQLVFAAFNGNTVRRDVIDRAFGHICERAKIKKTRLHDLRHSCATLLISSGVHLKTVQERLRHADIRTTGNIYSHVLPKMQKEANQHMSKVLKLERQKERQDEKATR